MPDTTPNGYPYAVPSDPLVQWPATSQSLAEKLDATPRVWCGLADTLPEGVTVQLPAGFTSGAVAVAVLVGAAGNTNPATVNCTAVTAGGQFTIFAFNGGASLGGQHVQWIAVQP
jgi:hypothetical protein